MTNPFIDDSIFKVVDLASQTLPAPALFVVGLPIGNLGDITLRALYTLNQVDAIGAEDTRQTLKLLDKFNIAKPLFSVHQHNEHRGAEKIIAFLKEGKRVASSPMPELPRFPILALKLLMKFKKRVSWSFRSPVQAQS